MILNTADIPNLYENEERLQIIESVGTPFSFLSESFCRCLLECVMIDFLLAIISDSKTWIWIPTACVFISSIICVVCTSQGVTCWNLDYYMWPIIVLAKRLGCAVVWRLSCQLKTVICVRNSAPSAPLANSTMSSTATMLYRWEDEMTRESTDHPPSYAKAKRIKLLTLHTLHGIIH